MTTIDMYFCIVIMDFHKNKTLFLSCIITLILTTVFFGCKEKNLCNSSYFGGKIINPKSNNIVLFKNDIALDTFYLNQNNTFLGEIPYINEGLYYFKHGNEHQYVYLEPRDSLLIRLNTWDFDESLVFSGIGAERNNLLIDCFLETEKDEKAFYSYYDLSPLKFRIKVDSTENLKLDRFNEYVSAYPKVSDKFKNIFKIALTFPLYTRVENYPMAHSVKMNDGIHNKINNHFYKHRDNISLDQDSIMYFYAYRDFIISHLYNEVHSLGHKISSDEFTTDLLKTIARKIKNENSKNSMLRQAVITHFYSKSSSDINKKPFNTFLNLSTNLKDKKLVNQLLKDINKIQIGVVLHDFMITDFNQTKKSIKTIIKDKNTVLFFWNPEYMSKKFIGSRVEFLSKKYPSLKFIGVKINGDPKDRMKELDIKSQFYLELDSKANNFMTSGMPRTILINKKGKVTNGFASISSTKIFSQLDIFAQK